MVPAKLVWHILWEEYVDMAELLKDNVKAERRLAAEGGMAPMLTAVVVPAHPGKTKELLAYQALVVSEAVYSGPLRYTLDVYLSPVIYSRPLPLSHGLL